jgi:hypothetical protein
MSNGNAQPAIAQTPVCHIGNRCHVSGKGIKTFGTKFSQKKVVELASSSVQLVGKHAVTSKVTRLASGVLIAPEVVLCDLHSLTSFKAGGTEILMFFECDAKTAPPGAFFQYVRTKRSWPSCTELDRKPQAVEVKTLEVGKVDTVDYALLLIKWNDINAGVVTLPRIPVMPNPGQEFSSEMLLIGHPQDSQDQGEPTQACAFRLLRERGPNPTTGDGVSYGYGEFNFTKGEGFSGGGVFNDKGQLVGLLKGSPGDTLRDKGILANHFAFLNLHLAAQRTENDPTRGRLALWFKTGNPLKPSDPSTSPKFKQK